MQEKEATSSTLPVFMQTPGQQTEGLLSLGSMFFFYTKQFCINDILIILQEKTKPAQAPPLFNEEEKEEKNDRPHITKSNQAQDALWSSEEPEAVPVPRGTDVERQVTKEKVRHFLTLT